MKPDAWLAGAVSTLLISPLLACGEIRVTVEHNESDQATQAFKFERVPAPSKNDAASKAAFSIVSGKPDRNGGNLDTLHDGKLPREEDEPGSNFFFGAGTDGGRLAVDLGEAIQVKAINTYSWHAGARAPQVYKLYASDGHGQGFKAQPASDTRPEDCGWNLVASVDTRPKNEDFGGQYGVSVSETSGLLGAFRYLLFEIHRTEDQDPFGNTFFSEIDVVDGRATESPQPAAAPEEVIAKTFSAAGGKYQITIDTTSTPKLTDWANQQLSAVMVEWYPKLVDMLPSQDYEAAKRISVVFKPGDPGVPAAAGGSRITCNSTWFEENLQGEAKGSVVHEMVHVVQHYGRRKAPTAVRPPGWLVEGIADYIRWFKYEPEVHGAEITRHNLNRARYDANYRISANFLNWAVEKYDHDLVKELNAALREGAYNEGIWKERTGHTVQELGDEWRAAMEKQVGSDRG